MSYFDQKEPPKREDRLNAVIAHGSTICSLANRKNCKCMNDGDRLFTQGSICQLLPALAIMNSFADSAILLHGAVGCGSCVHSQNAVIKSGTHKKAFVKKTDFPEQLFLPKLPPPATPGFFVFSALCLPLPLPHILNVRYRCCTRHPSGSRCFV